MPKHKTNIIVSKIANLKQIVDGKFCITLKHGNKYTGIPGQANYKIVRDFVSAQVSGCNIGRYPELYNPDGTIKKPACPVHASGSLDYFFTHFTYIELKNPYNNQLAVNRINNCGNTIEANGCIELSAPNASKFVIKSFYTDKDGKQQILGPHTILTEWYLK